jgi:SAM-dependent methyltransferase
MTGTENKVDPVSIATQHAGLGIPIPRRGRLPFLKRALARIGRPFLHHQVAYNKAAITALGQLRVAIQHQYHALTVAETRIGNEIAALRSDLVEIHQAVVDAQTDGGGARSADAGGASARYQERHGGLPSRDEEFYEAFEDTFRGSFELITERQRPYLSDLRGMPSTGRVLDVGAGRGEWLELLTGEGFDAYGVDSNASAIERCRERGLNVVHCDALHHLATLPDAALAALTAFQFIEHVLFDNLTDLLDQAARVLRPGGILILETPNPANLLVGSSLFYVDPTHQRPIHPALLEFLYSTRGFAEIEVRYLHSTGQALEASTHSELARQTVEPVLQQLNALLFGALDYAVLGRRPYD